MATQVEAEKLEEFVALIRKAIDMAKQYAQDHGLEFRYDSILDETDIENAVEEQGWNSSSMRC